MKNGESMSAPEVAVGVYRPARAVRERNRRVVFPSCSSAKIRLPENHKSQLGVQLKIARARDPVPPARGFAYPGQNIHLAADRPLDVFAVNFKRTDGWGARGDCQ